jgi:hypothetical protein
VKALIHFIRREAFHMVRMRPSRFEHIDKFILSLGLGLSLPNHEIGVCIEN